MINETAETSVSQADVLLPMPSDGEVFELTLDADTIDPLDMIQGWSFDPKWQFEGECLAGVHTGSFKWMGIVNRCIGTERCNLDIIRRFLKVHGTIPEGQWIEAVRLVYKPHRMNYTIADPSWVGVYGHRYFPGIDYLGRLGFKWFVYNKPLMYPERWLVRLDT